jgi:hypothetical protein
MFFFCSLRGDMLRLAVLSKEVVTHKIAARDVSREAVSTKGETEKQKGQALSLAGGLGRSIESA